MLQETFLATCFFLHCVQNSLPIVLCFFFNLRCFIIAVHGDGLEFLIDGVSISCTQVLAWRRALNAQRDTILRSGAVFPIAVQDSTW